MPLTKPLNNNVLIEVLREDDGVSRADQNESKSFGRLIDWSLGMYHITASAGIVIDHEFGNALQALLEAMKGKIVRWEEFAEGGQTFEEDGKLYALIPWWRLIGVKEDAK